MSVGARDLQRLLFDACIAAAPDERRRLLETSRTTDPALVREVEAMLRLHEATDAMLDRPPEAVSGGAGSGRIAAGDGQPAGVLAPGTVLGRYTIRALLGYGGMGVVYEAEQHSPRRLVALKLIRSELVTGSLLRRFEHEAAALGLLQHPGIAQVYEAGSAEIAGAARPFIAMELLRGEPVTDYVRRCNPGFRAVVGLVAQVAEAVDHAHRRGVIHRDLKPANIVFTTEGVPKILDFGVARLTARSDEQAGATVAGQIIGTLGYLAPEQALGDPARVDARCDVYALGVVAYELIAGQHPAPASGSSLRDVVTSLERQVVKPPSVFLPAARGDLDTVVMHALEQDPERRYQHAADFAADLRRVLADQPILARPPSTVYHLRKLAARNRLGVAAAAAVLVAVGIGVIGLAAGLLRAREQAERTQRVNLYLRSMLTLDAHELVGRDRSLLKAMLDQAVAKLGRLDDDPAAQDAILAVVGNAYAEFGYPSDALKILPEVARRQRARLGPRHVDAMFAADALAHALLVSGDHAGALPVLEELYAARQSVDGDDAARTQTTLNNLVLVLRTQNQRPRALSLAQALLERRAASLGSGHEQTLHAQMVVGGILAQEGRFEEAEAALRGALVGFEAARGERDPQTVIARFSWCDFLKQAGREQEYIREAAALWPVALEVMGENYNPLLGLMQQLATLLVEHNRRAEAGPVFERVLAIQPRIYPDHPNTLALFANASMYFANEGAHARAAELCEQAIVTCERIRPEATGLRAELLRRTGVYRLRAGDASGGYQLIHAAIELSDATEPRDTEFINAARSDLADACEAMGRLEEAAGWRKAEESGRP